MPEKIGAPDCPLILRWTIVAAGKPTTSPEQEAFPLLRLPKWLTRDRKLMVHHFMPNVEDRDCHDHPRPFWTLVLRGRYFDLVPCEHCRGEGIERLEAQGQQVGALCRKCGVAGVVVGDVMKAGMLRRRPAHHSHITRTDDRGAWTLVLMGPLARPWGFWRAGRWWPWRDYEAEFGFAMRCPTDADREGELLKYSDAMVPPKVER